MCVLESIAGLSASVVSEDGSCLQSSDVSIRVSLQKGSLVRLVFLLSGLNGSFSQSREMLGKTALYSIRNPFQGTQTNYPKVVVKLHNEATTFHYIDSIEIYTCTRTVDSNLTKLKLHY